MRAEVFTNQQDFGAVAQDLQTTQDAPNNVPARRLQLPHGPGALEPGQTHSMTVEIHGFAL